MTIEQRDLRREIRNLSNEMLDQELAGYYWRAHHDLGGKILNPDTGVLGQLWEEFDGRVESGAIEIE